MGTKKATATWTPSVHSIAIGVGVARRRFFEGAHVASRSRKGHWLTSGEMSEQGE